jgi:hypothetical protein
MDQTPKSTHQSAPAPEAARAKKPWRKPAFEWERAFETMALACGKINVTQMQCKSNRKNS